MITKKTTIIATPQNIELIETFLEANKLEATVGTHRVSLLDSEEENYVRIEHYYHAISIDYDSDHTDVLIMNMSMTNNGLNNMLIDYLIKARAYPIVMASFSPKAPSNARVEENFRTKVIPKLKKDLMVKYPNVPIESMIKE